jgi:hypothetical protein
MSEQLRILELIEAGEISAEEGARRLGALAEAAETTKPPEPPAAPRPALVRWLWQGAFWTGVALLAGGGLLMASVYSQGGATGGLVWGWILFIFGVLVTLLGWWLQRAHWLSVRVRQSKGPNVTIALPMPLTLTAWALRIARPFVSELEETRADELLLALRDEIRNGNPFFVEVNDEEDGEHVQVYFG